MSKNIPTAPKLFPHPSTGGRSRNYALDLIRIIATLSVISIHFFKNVNFYAEPVSSPRMFRMTLLRTASSICVPLFIVLTGYLMRKKELSKSYYHGIKKTLFIYVTASIAAIVFKVIQYHQNFSIGKAITDILGFNAAYYSWYIEMYIGLFLLIPFLNTAYNGLKSKKHKLALVVTLFGLTILPSVINIYQFKTADWWSTPSISKEYDKLIPGWWMSVYPLAYYYLGCYLSEFKPRLNKLLNVALLVAGVFAFGCFNFYRSKGTVFMRGVWTDWNSVQSYTLTLLVFLLFYDLELERMPGFLKKTLSFLSGLCLGVYLTSGVIDRIVYKPLLTKVPEVSGRYPYYFLMVPLIFVLCLAASLVINLLYPPFDLLTKKIAEKICHANQKK